MSSFSLYSLLFVDMRILRPHTGYEKRKKKLRYDKKTTSFLEKFLSLPFISHGFDATKCTQQKINRVWSGWNEYKWFILDIYLYADTYIHCTHTFYAINQLNSFRFKNELFFFFSFQEKRPKNYKVKMKNWAVFHVCVKEKQKLILLNTFQSV